MQSRFNLKPVLQSLGISDVFSPSAADFRGISGRIVKLKTCYTSHRLLRNNHKHHQFKSRIHSVKIKPSV